MTVAEKLQEALDIYRSRGGTKRALEDWSGKVCINGALNLAHHGDWNYRWVPHTPVPGETVRIEDTHEALAVLARVIKEQWPDLTQEADSVSITVAFNNQETVTQEDVERVFEKAIVLAEEQGL